MKKKIAAGILFIILSSIALLCTAEGYGSIPAFPGAEGAGKYATGGRGGEVYCVTNLLDYLPGETPIPGSFRDAVSQGNRIVVFKVSGNIALKDNLSVTASNLTIAGQSAPGGGICFQNYSVSFGGDNIIVRFLRFRPGDSAQREIDAVGGYGRKLGIVDHVSASWGVDENLSFYNMTDFTVQWSVIAEANLHTVHQSGCHAFGGIVGGTNFSYHHNLLAHNISRNTRFGESADTEMVNNVIYNWGYACVYGDWDRLNFIGNYFKPGPSTDQMHQKTTIEIADPSFQTYMSGNYISADPAMTEDNWKAAYYKNGVKKEDVFLAEPIQMKNTNGQQVNTPATDSGQAYEEVLCYSGAVVPCRDETDTRVVSDCQNGTGNLKYTIFPVDPDTLTPAQTVLPGGTVIQHTLDEWERIQQFSGVYWEYDWEELPNELYPKDSNNDGIPDQWCLERGLNPYADIAGGDYTGDGYTNIEKYLNDLTADAFPPGVVSVSPKREIPDYDRGQLEWAAMDLEDMLAAVETPEDIVLPAQTVSGYPIVWTSLSACVQLAENQVQTVERQETMDTPFVLRGQITCENGVWEHDFFGTVKAQQEKNMLLDDFSAEGIVWQSSNLSLARTGDGRLKIQTQEGTAGVLRRSFQSQNAKGAVAEVGFRFSSADLARQGTVEWVVEEQAGDLCRLYFQADGSGKIQCKAFTGGGNSWQFLRSENGAVFKIDQADTREYEIKCVLDLIHTYENGVNNYDPLYDVYLLCEGQAVAAYTGAQRQKLSQPYTGILTGTRLSFSGMAENSSFLLDDFYLHNVSAALRQAAESLFCPAQLKDGDALPSLPLSGIGVLWTAPEPAEVSGGKIVYKGTENLETSLCARLSYGADGGISVQEERTFPVLLQAPDAAVSYSLIDIYNQSGKKVLCQEELTEENTASAVVCNQTWEEKNLTFTAVVERDGMAVQLYREQTVLEQGGRWKLDFPLCLDPARDQIRMFLWEENMCPAAAVKNFL